jgi:hypothetical protein
MKGDFTRSTFTPKKGKGKALRKTAAFDPNLNPIRAKSQIVYRGSPTPDPKPSSLKLRVSRANYAIREQIAL